MLELPIPWYAVALMLVPWLWIANILIIIGLWTLAYKWRPAFLFSIAGETLYALTAWNTEQYELCFICVVFCALALRNYIKWGKPDA